MSGIPDEDEDDAFWTAIHNHGRMGKAARRQESIDALSAPMRAAIKWLGLFLPEAITFSGDDHWCDPATGAGGDSPVTLIMHVLDVDALVAFHAMIELEAARK